MLRNRGQLVELMIGNLANAIVHRILEKAIFAEKKELADKYRKELINSFEIAKRYRNMINPINVSLPEKDIAYIKERLVKRIKGELGLRISKGYENIDLGLVEEDVDRVLEELGIL